MSNMWAFAKHLTDNILREQIQGASMTSLEGNSGHYPKIFP